MAWRSFWDELHNTEAGIPSKKAKASFPPGNDIKTSKDSTKRDTNIQTELQESTKAGAAECTESRRPKPPNRNGKVTWDQLLSDMPQHKILLRHSRNLKSNRERKEPREENGTHRKKWKTLQTPRQLLRRCNSTWGSSRKTNLSWIVTILSNCVDKNESKNCGGLQIEDLRRSKPLLTGLIRLMAGGNWEKNYHWRASIVHT